MHLLAAISHLAFQDQKTTSLGITDGDLDMGFELDARSLERECAFMEHTARGVELATPVNLKGRDGILQDEVLVRT